MKKQILILAALALMASGCDTANTLADSRDGKKYKTVQIGNRVWMAENLNYEAQGSRCYGADPANCKKYGRLYYWETAMKACPAGWHLPSYGEWQKLVEKAGDEEVAGKKLKAKSGWNDYEGISGNGTDEFGFSALPGGFVTVSDNFDYAGNMGCWWSATELANGDMVYVSTMEYSDGGVHLANAGNTKVMRSVRCVCDTDLPLDEEPENTDTDIEKLTLKGDMYYLNAEPYTGTVRKDDDWDTEKWEMKNGRFHGAYTGSFLRDDIAGDYKDGRKHGEWKLFRNGKLYKTETWKDGVLINEWTAENEHTGGQAGHEQALPTLTPSETVEFASEAPSAEDAYGFKDDPNGKYYHFGSFVSDGDTQWDGFWYSEKFTATSTLAPQGNISYSTENLENNTKVGGIRGTTWCEGVKGHGTGERITMSIRTKGAYQDAASFYQLLIVNGYARNAATWKNNTRVKTLRLYLGDKAWCDLQLSDIMKPQIFTLPDNLWIVPAQSGRVIDKGDPSAKRVSGVGNFPTYQTDLAFEIIEVYPGDKYDDTCITGIALDVASGGVY